MKLIYCYIKRFRNIEGQEVRLSDEYKVQYADEKLVIQKCARNTNMDYLYGNGFMRDLHVLVGKTGSGKTNFLQLLGMDKYRRRQSSENDQYLLIYKKADGYVAEVVGLRISGIPEPDFGREYLYGFDYDYSNDKLMNVRRVQYKDFEDTYVINAFDRYSFAHCPYEDEHKESYHQDDTFIPRIIAQFGKSHASIECECLWDYLAGFPSDNVKRKSSFVICRDNWKYKSGVNLDEELLKSDYWTYKERADEQRLDNLKKGLRGQPQTFPPKSTPKSRFIHDLMTDFAIYLRKHAECVDPDFPVKYYPYSGYVHNLGIDDPTVLPDGMKMSILKRIDWLCQYIDYHTDEMTSNHGLVWQIGQDICRLFHVLNRIDDRYFTDEMFSIPVIEIDFGNYSPMGELYEIIDQYRPDEYGIFTQCLLPYHWTHVSSGEYQYAKVWGILEEFGVKIKVMSQYETFNDARHPNIILLLDEPECYMHPEMCRGFIAQMSKILERRSSNTEFQIILSTHSPFMLSDVMASQVIKMNYDSQGKCIITQDAKPYFAANIHSIMSDGFFLEYTIGEQARSFISGKIDLLKEMIARKDNLTDDDRTEIKRISDMLPEIGDEMIKKCLTVMIDNLNDKALVQ